MQGAGLQHEEYLPRSRFHSAVDIADLVPSDFMQGREFPPGLTLVMPSAVRFFGLTSYKFTKAEHDTITRFREIKLAQAMAIAWVEEAVVRGRAFVLSAQLRSTLRVAWSRTEGFILPNLNRDGHHGGTNSFARMMDLVDRAATAESSWRARRKC